MRWDTIKAMEGGWNFDSNNWEWSGVGWGGLGGLLGLTLKNVPRKTAPLIDPTEED